MSMNFAGYYDIHNNSMNKFIERFNALDDDNILMIANRKETYSNDGSILLSDLGVAIGFDWEYRKTGYDSFDNFMFKRWGVGQYGTKLAKPSIKLSLQISKDETGLLVAFHDDFEKLTNVSLTSETKVNRKENMSCTHKYIEIDIRTDAGLIQFKNILRRAAERQTYNHTVFAA